MPKPIFSIKAIEKSQERIVNHVLRSLPDYFGFESAIVDYCEASRNPDYKTLAAVTSDGVIAGFAILTMNNSMTAEIFVIGVLPEFHGTGAGQALVQAIEHECKNLNAKYLMVKTIGPSQGNPNFLKTFQFYIKCGFDLLVEYDMIWRGSYCAILIKKL